MSEDRKTLRDADILRIMAEGPCKGEDLIKYYSAVVYMNNEYELPFFSLESIEKKVLDEAGFDLSVTGFAVVIAENPTSGIVYKCGGHELGEWEQVGTTIGYA